MPLQIKTDVAYIPQGVTETERNYADQEDELRQHPAAVDRHPSSH